MTAPADLRCMGLLMRCRTSTRCRLYESHPGPCLYNALYDTGEGVENIADRVGIREDANACLSEETGDRQCVRPVGHGGMHSVVPWTEDRPDEEPEDGPSYVHRAISFPAAGPSWGTIHEVYVTTPDDGSIRIVEEEPEDGSMQPGQYPDGDRPNPMTHERLDVNDVTVRMPVGMLAAGAAGFVQGAVAGAMQRSGLIGEPVVLFRLHGGDSPIVMFDQGLVDPYTGKLPHDLAEETAEEQSRAERRAQDATGTDGQVAEHWRERARSAEQALAEAEETIDNYDIDTVVELVTEARKWRDRKRASSAPIYPHDRVLIRAIDRLDRDDDPEEHGTPTETGATDRQGRCTVPEPPPGPDGRCGACGRHRA